MTGMGREGWTGEDSLKKGIIVRFCVSPYRKEIHYEHFDAVGAMERL
jgi:hypothetical protein